MLYNTQFLKWLGDVSINLKKQLSHSAHEGGRDEQIFKSSWLD